MKSLKTASGLLLILILVLAVTAGCQSTPVTPSDTAAPADASATKTGPFKGMQAPDFTLKDMADTSWTLSELKGNAVALIFFTSW